MSDDTPFRIRPGRIRSPRVQRTKPFIAQALAAAKRAGANVSRSGMISSGNRSRFGRGKLATIRAERLVNARSRRVIIKTRVVRHNGRTTPVGVHLNYLGRDGVTKDGERGQFFNAELETGLDISDGHEIGLDTGNADTAAFADRCKDDRHHFRFIISPEDAGELCDIKSYTRDLVQQMESDLGTNLDWVAVDHWNTEHPHVHLLVRGVDDKGGDLVISRNYISEGMRDRARDLVTMELGPRTDLEIHNTLTREVDAERWTRLDRQLVRDVGADGIINLAPDKKSKLDETRPYKLGRLNKLQSMELATQLSPGQWIIHEEAEATLRELGERGDIIKRMHRAMKRALTERGIERGASSYVLASEALETPVIGRLIDRGLDNELQETAWVVVDGVDGRSHHIKLPSLDAAGDSSPGSIVELRKFEDAHGNQRHAIAVRSDLDLEAQIEAKGATWLDRQNIARDPVAVSTSGFGAEVTEARDRRARQLVQQGMARQSGNRIIFNRNLLDTLTRRELDETARQLTTQTGRPYVDGSPGEYVSGTYSRRINLASGRFAMVDVMTEGGMGFQLVPWTPSIEKKLGQQITGVMRTNGSINWSLGRGRGIGM